MRKERERDYNIVNTRLGLIKISPLPWRGWKFGAGLLILLKLKSFLGASSWRRLGSQPLLTVGGHGSLCFVRQLLCAGCGLSHCHCAPVHAKRSVAPLSLKKTQWFWHILPPRCPLGPDAPRCPRCLSDVSQMPPRCLPDASQMPPRCLPDASQQMPLRCLPDASQQMPPSQMF